MSAWANIARSLTLAKLSAVLTKALVQTKLQDSGYRFVIHPLETANGLTAANLTFGFDVGDLRRYGCKCDGLTDDTANAQVTANFCVAANLEMIVPAMTLISTVNLNRQADGAAYDDYLQITGLTGGGFTTSTAAPMFSSTLAYSGAPVSQLFRFNKINFSSSTAALTAYVLDRNLFLRTDFVGCSFSQIKLLSSAAYVQSIHLIDCNARRWSGDFMAAGPQAYDIHVLGGLYEAGTGNCFNLTNPIGCRFDACIEGMSGTALLIPNANGVDIGGYFESNGLDMDCRTGATNNYGIAIHGAFFSNTTSTYTVKWGPCAGCSSSGNWHTGYMHDLLPTSEVEINDHAQNGLSNLDAATNWGYREGNTPALVIRGSNSASYSVSGLVSKYSLQSKRLHVEFTCTLTSTGTNPADMIYIPSLFPFAAKTAGLICGMVEVIGSTVNNGISPLYLPAATPTVQSSVNVIPANVNGNSWTVRAQLSYLIP